MKYIIGDLQGCYDELMQLLEDIKFDDANDELYFTGDLINRGPKSLETLRFVKSLKNKNPTVLGNHDLHCLALYHNAVPKKKSDTLDELLSAPDCDELMYWLSQQKIALHFENENAVLVHAGIYPAWDVNKTLALAQEVESSLKDPEFYKHMYGNTPNQWHDALSGWDRLRCITNVFTRMRFLTKDLELDFQYKREIGSQPNDLKPWFDFDRRSDCKILFGHWAAILGKTNHNDIIGLDTGCVWGGHLTALDLTTA